MALPHHLGLEVEIDLLIPPVAEMSKLVEAGGLAFAIEYRHLTPAVHDRLFGNEESKMDVVRRFSSVYSSGDSDEGPSLHVSDVETGDEYLRFDIFAKHPHYHYIVPGSHHVRVAFDTVSNTDYLAWLSSALRSRLREMLIETAGTERVLAFDFEQISEALPSVLVEIDLAVGASVGVTDAST